MRSRLLWAVLCVTGFACQPSRFLDVIAQPTRIDAHGQVTRIRVSAGEGDGSEASGAVKVSSAVGSLKQPESATLLSGGAEVGFSCDVAVDPGCDGAVKITAVWKGITAETEVTVGGSAGGGTGGGGISPGFITACKGSVDGTVAASVHIDADDKFALYVNGTLIDDNPPVWFTPSTYSVTLYTHPSRSNVIAVKAWNEANTDNLDRALIADVSWTVGTFTSHLVTNASWKLTQTMETGWETPTFSDGAWRAATVVGDNGVQPYGNVFGTSSAKWIWSYLAAGPASGKMLTDEIYTRVKFSMVESGLPSFNPPQCPP